MSARELAEWAEFFRIEPFGEIRDNWHMAVLAHIVSSAFSSGGHKPKVEDFMWVAPDERKKRMEQAVIAWFDEHSN